MQPLFSILHTSARPDQWRKVYDAWIGAAVNPEQVEYVLCVDERWRFEVKADEPLSLSFKDFERERTASTGALRQRNKVTVNCGRRCYVDGVNTAAKASTGRVLIVNADDQYPDDKWDERLAYRILQWDRLEEIKQGKWDGGPIPSGDGPFMPLASAALYGMTAECGKDRDFVVEVKTGTPDEHARRIMVMPILSRARYERLGYVFYSEYESMYADGEFCEHAQQDGVVIDARHLFFPHRHAGIDPETATWKKTAAVDEAYLEQNRSEAYELGRALIEVRRRERFDPGVRHDIQRPAAVPVPATARSESRTIALCWPGETFHGEYVEHFVNLILHLGSRGFQVWRAREYTSNVYVTREQIRKVMMEQDPRPDLYIWFDDDNPPPTPQQFDLMLKDLDDSGVDGVTGWCWIYDKDKGTFYPSCGMWSADHLHWRPFDASDFPNEKAPRPIEVSGFPCFLMKHSALEKAGNRPFLPILDEAMDHGLSGEDMAFCRRAEDGGAKFLVEPRVRVRHLKICDVTPDPPKATCIPKIAVMFRVKNEARWVKRCIESVIPLAGEHIFVLDDESTDDTFQICKDLGVTVYRDPFPGLGVDETRDKDWLVEQIQAACAPDWILCLDGDEELEPGGAEKILRILSTNPPVDIFSMGFLFLWNRLDSIRADGRYSNLGRETLFRPKPGITFKSYYADGPGQVNCHVGLHCGNAPGGAESANLIRQPMNVYLLHYGYLFKEDRLRKYRWYRTVDPENEYEDNYRHMVLGDLPEFPADLQVKFGGPLKLLKLPPSMVPKFEVMPEPLPDSAEKSSAADSDSEADAIPGRTIPAGHREIDYSRLCPNCGDAECDGCGAAQEAEVSA